MQIHFTQQKNRIDRDSQLKNLKDRVAIVTGGARGIGFAICKELRKEGASVILADSGTSIDGTGSEPGLASDAAEVIGAVPFSDKLDGDSAKHLVDLAIKNFGSIDIVIIQTSVLLFWANHFSKSS